MVSDEDKAKLDALPLLLCGECNTRLQISSRTRDGVVKYQIVCGCAPSKISVKMAGNKLD